MDFADNQWKPLKESLKMTGESKQQVLIIGAGPAGLFAARKLVEDGYKVVILNRDIKPGGLAEYGIYYDKYVIKNGLRKQFKQIMALPEVKYIGNVTVGENDDISLKELQGLGFKTILVTAGAQQIKSLGLEGENLDGVYHAKNVVFHYNNLPPYSTDKYRIQGRQTYLPQPKTHHARSPSLCRCTRHYPFLFFASF